MNIKTVKEAYLMASIHRKFVKKNNDIDKIKKKNKEDVKLYSFFADQISFKGDKFNIYFFMTILPFVLSSLIIYGTRNNELQSSIEFFLFLFLVFTFIWTAGGIVTSVILTNNILFCRKNKTKIKELILRDINLKRQHNSSYKNLPFYKNILKLIGFRNNEALNMTDNIIELLTEEEISFLTKNNKLVGLIFKLDNIDIYSSIFTNFRKFEDEEIVFYKDFLNKVLYEYKIHLSKKGTIEKSVESEFDYFLSIVNKENLKNNKKENNLHIYEANKTLVF